MPLQPTWSEILFRLVLTFIVGAVIGFDRERQNHPAGLRTTILVALAAAVAMIQADLLLATRGKAADAFATMDVMRLPLGILTGVGFIGGGAILKHGGSVSGVTTAATLWIVTAIGLCFGGGQIALGLAATALAAATVFGMRWIDRRLPRRRRALLTIAVAAGDAVPDLTAVLTPLGCRATFAGHRAVDGTGRIEIRHDLQWVQRGKDDTAEAILTALRGLDVRFFDPGREGDG